jgi:ubiquinone/menaquinone biosynthesis C-methylase UbiE
MDEAERGQVTANAAEVYEEFFVPALFREWADRVADAAAVGPGARVLDVACGTGALTRAVAARVGARGAAIGLDVNADMLAVARRKAPALEWRQGRAEAFGFDSGRFDAVVSQFGLMFFEDRRAALAEMMRVLRPGGRLAVAVWDALERTPGYGAVTLLLQRLFGERSPLRCAHRSHWAIRPRCGRCSRQRASPTARSRPGRAGLGSRRSEPGCTPT